MLCIAMDWVYLLASTYGNLKKQLRFFLFRSNTKEKVAASTPKQENMSTWKTEARVGGGSFIPGCFMKPYVAVKEKQRKRKQTPWKLKQMSRKPRTQVQAGTGAVALRRAYREGSLG